MSSAVILTVLCLSSEMSHAHVFHVAVGAQLGTLTETIILENAILLFVPGFRVIICVSCIPFMRSEGRDN